MSAYTEDHPGPADHRRVSAGAARLGVGLRLQRRGLRAGQPAGPGLGPGGRPDPHPASEAGGTQPRPARRRLRGRHAPDHRHHRHPDPDRDQPGEVRPHQRRRAGHLPQREGRAGAPAAAGLRLRGPGQTTTSSACASSGCRATSTAAGPTSSASSTASRCFSSSCKNVHKDLRAAYREEPLRLPGHHPAPLPPQRHHHVRQRRAGQDRHDHQPVRSTSTSGSAWPKMSPAWWIWRRCSRASATKRNFMDLFENFILFDESARQDRRRSWPETTSSWASTGPSRRSAIARDGRASWASSGTPRARARAIPWSSSPARCTASWAATSPSWCSPTARTWTRRSTRPSPAAAWWTTTSEPCRASSGEHLSRLLAEHKAYVFSLIQKFNQKVDPDEGYTQRDDIIVITDEAHRTQYGTLALNMRNALPNASYIGFTGTPLFKDDEITRRVFGDYVSTYDFQRAVEDKATVPLYYDARGEKLGLAIDDLNERIAEKLEELEIEDIDVAAAPGAGTQAGLPHHHRRQAAGPDRARFRAALLHRLGDRQGHAGLHRQDHLRADVRPDRQVLGRTHRASWRAELPAARLTSRRRSTCSGRSTGCERRGWRWWSARSRARWRSSASGTWTSCRTAG